MDFVGLVRYNMRMACRRLIDALAVVISLGSVGVAAAAEPLIHKLLRSGEIEYQRIATLHEGIISNFERLIDGYLAGLDSDLLVKAAHAVNGGSFGPIADIGF